MILFTLNFVIPRNSTTIEMTKESSIVRHPLKNNFTTQQWYALQDELFNTHLSFNFLLVNKRENVVVVVVEKKCIVSSLSMGFIISVISGFLTWQATIFPFEMKLLKKFFNNNFISPWWSHFETIFYDWTAVNGF